MVINFDIAKKASQLQKEYNEFLKTVIKNDSLWFLFREGRIAIVETAEGDCAPVWSTEKKAAESKKEEWKLFETLKVPIAEFISLCEPDLFDDGVDIIAELSDGSGIYKHIQSFEDDLFEEADRQGVPLADMCMDLEDFMEASDCFEGFVEDLLDEGRIWILEHEDGEIVFADVEDADALPMWVCEGEARNACTGEWEDCKPQAMSFEEFLGEWAPVLEKSVVSIMFSLDDMGGMGTDAKMLADALRRAKARPPRPQNPNNIINFPLQ